MKSEKHFLNQMYLLFLRSLPGDSTVFSFRNLEMIPLAKNLVPEMVQHKHERDTTATLRSYVNYKVKHEC